MNVDVVFSLFALTLGFSVVLNRPLMAFPAATIGYVSIASLGTLAELWWGFDSRIVSPALSAAVFLIVLLICKPKSKVVKFGLVYGSIVSGLFFAIEQVSRELGLSSIAFTDGHTLLVRSYDFSIGNADLLLGSTGLKRGFGLSALHAQGIGGEYLVGLMPFITVAAIFATSLAIIQIFGRNFSSYVGIAVMLFSSLFVEGISRHFYLVNSHSLVWLSMALLIGVLVSSRVRELGPRDWFLATTVFASIGFLRLDYVVVFAVVGLLLITLQAKSSPIAAWSPTSLMVLSSFSWIVTVTDRFPFGGVVGLYSYLILGVVLPIFFSILVRRDVVTSSVIVGRAYWYLSGALLLFFLSQVSFFPSLMSFLTNIFLGEGLWGGFFYFLVVMVLIAIILSSQQNRQPSMLVRLFLLTFLAFLILKSFDNFEVRGAEAGFSRIGFGDSLNRNLVMWLPFAVILVSWVQEQILRKTQPRGH